nr:hypothetical protein Iba_chr09aCG13690 [Ipomoea batatas]
MPTTGEDCCYRATNAVAGGDGDRSCYVLADCSTLPPAICFVDAVAVYRRRMITVTRSSRCWFTEPIAADNREPTSPLLLPVGVFGGLLAFGRRRSGEGEEREIRKGNGKGKCENGSCYPIVYTHQAIISRSRFPLWVWAN